ncbi:TPA: hypothetical protein SIA27_000376 [Aeromonas salmonicida]|nr:hypothetical protein [Aeromonas salmonicida]
MHRAPTISTWRGFTQKADNSCIQLLHRDISFIQIAENDLDNDEVLIKPGDTLFILPQVDIKSLQLFNFCTKIAVSAKRLQVLDDIV